MLRNLNNNSHEVAGGGEAVVSRRNKDGKTPLHLSAGQGQRHISISSILNAKTDFARKKRKLF